MRTYWQVLCLALLLAAVHPHVAAADCSDDEIQVNHDYSFEYGYCAGDFGVEGVQEPYSGSLAEGFDLGPGRVDCASFWVTQIGYMWYEENDIYVWDGGVTREPGEVLALVPGVPWDPPGFWPEFTRTDVPLSVCVTSDFTVGCWQHWFGGWCNEYICADLDGPGGHPWTHIAPGLQWPSGWQDPSIVFGPIQSMAIGVQFSQDPASVEDEWEDSERPASPTWGGIKALFR
jgi:hypothetical protein